LRNKTRLYVSALLVFALGLGAALAIYITADEREASAAMDEMVSSKPYQHELQRFGGKAAVLFDEFNRWFAALWQGKALGVTLAWISVFVSALIFLIARRS
jgi:hypothetical protein